MSLLQKLPRVLIPAGEPLGAALKDEQCSVDQQCQKLWLLERMLGSQRVLETLPTLCPIVHSSQTASFVLSQIC